MAETFFKVNGAIHRRRATWMARIGKIITVGLCPAWDTVCAVDGVDWGEHAVVAERKDIAAGKALNVSRALAEMGEKSIAAGLWGKEDYRRMLDDLRPLRGKITVRMTAAAGGTRHNITVVDRRGGREMHLRNRCGLATKRALAVLKRELAGIVSGNSVCVFAGAMPAGMEGEVVGIVKACAAKGARVAVDTSGKALKRIVAAGGLWMVKPNVRELGEMVGYEVGDTVRDIVGACQGVLGKAEIVLVSWGARGAVAVTKEGVWEARAAERRKVLSTVGCGDYLLAGFLKGMKETGRIEDGLISGIRAASARAWGMSTVAWARDAARVEVRVERKNKYERRGDERFEIASP